MDKQPPNFLRMKWYLDGYRFAAAMPTVAFWPIWNAETDALRNAGFSCGKDGETWLAFYNPKYDCVADVQALCYELELAYAGKIEEAKATQAAKERSDEEAKERAREAYEAWLDENADEIRKTVTRAQGLLNIYGEAVVGKARIAEWLTRRPSRVMLTQLQDLSRVAEKRLYERNLEASTKVGGVDWSEETVVRAVEILTGLDEDHAEEANGIGWSAGHSAAGHWCAAAIENPAIRGNGIKLARHLVGHYVKQLSRYLPELTQRGRAG